MTFDLSQHAQYASGVALQNQRGDLMQRGEKPRVDNHDHQSLTMTSWSFRLFRKTPEVRIYQPHLRI